MGTPVIVVSGCVCKAYSNENENFKKLKGADFWW